MSTTNTKYNTATYILLLSTATSLVSLVMSFGFTAELIRHDEPGSPLYNPSATVTELTHFAMVRSVHRGRRITRNLLSLSTAATVTANFSSPLFAGPDDGEFLMQFNIGTPPVKTVAIADTGSDLTWTTCVPCTSCHKQSLPVFDPNESSTYRNVSCESSACSTLNSSASCSSSSTCEYHYIYGDGTNSRVGILGTETLTFGPSTTVPNVFFGCTHEENDGNAGPMPPAISGLVGLGASGFSLVAQLGNQIENRFSYCLAKRGSSARSQINFGANAVVRGSDVVQTPLLSHSVYYKISLQKITVGSTVITYPGNSTANMVVDSGMTMTLLEPSFLRGVVQAVDALVDLQKVYPVHGMELCYDTSGVDESRLNLPDLKFGFDGADVVVGGNEAFLLVAENTVCLSLTSDEYVGVQVFGNTNQLNYHVGYDLGAKRLSFAKADCVNL